MKTANEDLKSDISAARAVGQKGSYWVNHAIGLNVFREETGEFIDSRLPIYNLDEATKTRLLAHGRQDIAHALCNTKTLLDEIARLRRLMNFYGCVTVGVLLALAYRLS